MGRLIDRLVYDLATSRILTKKIVAFPIARRPDRPGNKAAATVWADVAQNIIDTLGTERALVCANTRLE